MPVSVVVETNDEVKAAMKADNATAKEIDRVLTERDAQAVAIQSEYDTKTSAKFDAALAQQNRT